MEHANGQCRDLVGALSAYVDGEASDALCIELEQHMAGCENCRIVVDTLRKTIYLYHVTAEPPETPPDVQQRLYKRLELEAYLRKGK